MAKNKKLRMVTISGLIAPSEWDEDDNIVNVSLFTLDEKEYRIKNNEKAEELLEFIAHEVIIRGYEEEDEYGNKIIIVNEFKVLGEKVFEEDIYSEKDFYDEDDDSDFDDSAFN